MNKLSDHSRSDLLRPKLVLAAALSLLILGWLSWDAYEHYREVEARLPVIARLEEVRTQILHLDEVLTMSARMAAATGNPDWEARYRRFEPQLDQAIKEALRLVPNASQGAAAAKTDAANAALVAMEHRAFELLGRGEKAEAQGLLSSAEYETQKRIYGEGMTEFNRQLAQSTGSLRAEMLADMRRSAILTIIAAALLILGAWFVLRAARRWQAAIVAGNRQLNQATAELEELNSQLDEMVRERTRELSEAVRQHQLAAERAEYLAYYDPLTGLANRSLFLDRLAQYMRGAASGGHQLAVAVIDLERFKNINDSLGQPAGDALLRQVAEWLMVITGDASLLARVGADHFAGVLLQVRQGGDVARLLEKTMEAFLNHPFRIDDGVFRLAAKVGVALYPEDGTDADTLFRNAEAALKRAKASGERYLFYTQTMTAKAAASLNLENQLRQALDNDEFVLHYQPKVSLASGKLVGAEALIRWNDPRTGLVPPGDFMPTLEATGLIYEVGRWALHQAIADYLRWRSAGLAVVRTAVKVSPLQLRHRGFVAEIEQLVGVDQLAAAALELEITESAIMEDIKRNSASLQAIRGLGVRIAIDDFGTGFSSLSYLARLPVDALKIDRAFVVDMTVGPEGLALVSTIIKLAQALKLKVVAEGVETEEQSRLLRLLNCDEMQGYYVSKPLPVEVFAAGYLVAPSATAA